MVDDDELDGQKDQEDHQADDIAAAHHELAESLDHVSGRRGSLVARVEQDAPGGRHVQGQAEERDHQQDGRIGAEILGAVHIHAHHQDH